MAELKLVLPAMGEGIFEATITQWLYAEGDKIEEDDSLVEIATDKVDSEVPAPANGVLSKILVPAGEVAKIGQEIAIIQTEGGAESTVIDAPKVVVETQEQPVVEESVFLAPMEQPGVPSQLPGGAFLSPLVRSIAEKENISLNQLEQIQGTGLQGRITKDDILAFVKQGAGVAEKKPVEPLIKEKPAAVSSENVEIIEMTRMRKLIAENMVQSKRVSPHVTSFHEVNMTPIVNWRNKNKNKFFEKYGEKLTFTPIFIEAVVNAIREYPLINVSVQDDTILLKKNMNIGMATALPDGNLIVPVIKNAQNLSLSGLAGQVNDLANRARTKKLMPDEIQGGTFTVTNVGSFGNLSGTPIISQPEVAILAVGTIKKRPAVIETPEGDTIGIQHQMILSLSYDHRVVDGSLGGMFLKKIADNLEAFDTSRVI